MTLVNVQLHDGGLITRMDDSELVRKNLVYEDDIERTRAVEYRLKTDQDNPRPVHRSVHVHMKTAVFGAGIAASF